MSSFNVKFRDECLNEHGFRELPHAIELINQRRIDYNENRPHSSLGYQTPLKSVASNRQIDFKTTGIFELKLD